MITVRKTNNVTLMGWPAVSVMMALTLTNVLTALVMSFPLAWLVDHVLAAGAIHAIFGTEHVGYWRCVGLFAIWNAARVRIKFSGPSRMEKRGN